MKADISLAERRRMEREQQAITAYWFAHTLEAGPRIHAILARMGCGSVPVSAPVVTAEPEPVAPLASVPEPLPVRAGAPNLPFGLRQRFGLQ